MYNTIILLKGERNLTKKEYESFSKGDTIFGIDSNPKEISRWGIKDEETAKAELEKYRCKYIVCGNSCSIIEYAAEYCETDSEGEYVSGSDFELAKED